MEQEQEATEPAERVEINKPSIFPEIQTEHGKVRTYKDRAREIRKRYLKVINEYSNLFPNKVVPKTVDLNWRGMNEKVKNKIEKWYYSLPKSTMHDMFKPQPLEFIKEKRLFNKKRNEFSGFVEATFKGGVINRPLLDPIRRPSTPEQYEIDMNAVKRVKSSNTKQTLE